MKILIIYATHTGSTLYASRELLAALSDRHTVMMKSVTEVKEADMEEAEVILIGSSSWDWQGNRGYPLKDMMDFMERTGGFDYSGKKVALFGCGDMDFEHFCGALDVIDEKLSAKGAHFLTDKLRLNRYFMDEFGNQERVREWAEKVQTALE